LRQTNLSQRAARAVLQLGGISATALHGRVTAVHGLAVEFSGLDSKLGVGDRITLTARDDRLIAAEIVGFHGRTARAMAFGDLQGVGPGSVVSTPLPVAGLGAADRRASLAPSTAWLGRVIDPMGQPLDGHGALPLGPSRRPIRADPPPANRRARLGPRLDLGVTVLNNFATCRAGQRIGLFAGSGIGKSSLLAMLARFADCDVIVLALVGERGREVREFLEDDLGPEGLARSVIVTATSDMQPLMRREAAYAAMTIAEHFRDEGKSVLLLMDSLTRFCLALREIGLSAGEPPATRGYPPSVFTELPRLLERAGPGFDGPAPAGQITALFTVLVEGDDHDEPVADAVRGILDGHVVLDRRIGEAGRYPAVNVLRSLSRTVPGCLEPDEQMLVRRARALLAVYADMADLVRLGAYKPGADAEVDEAVALAPRIEAMLQQGRDERVSLGEGFAALARAMEFDGGA
jgi:flagellum-specific ATP synthase